MYKLILFGDIPINHASKCFMVGMRGCTKIIGNFLGRTGGIDTYTYTVSFDDSKDIIIDNTVYVEEQDEMFDSEEVEE